MKDKSLKIIGLALAIGGAAVTVAAKLVGDKQNKIDLQAAVDKAVEAKLKEI